MLRMFSLAVSHRETAVRRLEENRRRRPVEEIGSGLCQQLSAME